MGEDKRRSPFWVPVELDGATFYIGTADEVFGRLADATVSHGLSGKIDVEALPPGLISLAFEWFREAVRDWENFEVNGQVIEFAPELVADVPSLIKLNVFGAWSSTVKEITQKKGAGENEPTLSTPQ